MLSGHGLPLLSLFFFSFHILFLIFCFSLSDLSCREHYVVLQVVNPPLFGVIAGVVIGLSPAGPLLFLPPSPSAPSMPFELRIIVGEPILHPCSSL